MGRDPGRPKTTRIYEHPPPPNYRSSSVPAELSLESLRLDHVELRLSAASRSDCPPSSSRSLTRQRNGIFTEGAARINCSWLGEEIFVNPVLRK